MRRSWLSIGSFQKMLLLFFISLSNVVFFCLHIFFGIEQNTFDAVINIVKKHENNKKVKKFNL